MNCRFLLAAISLIAVPIASLAQDGPVDQSKTHLKLIEPVPETGKSKLSLKPGEKVKISIELKQPKDMQQPDIVMVALERKNSTLGDLILERDGKPSVEADQTTTKSQGTFKIPSISQECALVVIAVYTVPSKTNPGKMDVIKVRSEPYKVEKP